MNDDNIAATEAMLERVSQSVGEAVDSGIGSHLWEKVTQLIRLRLGSGAIKWVAIGYDPARLDKFLKQQQGDYDMKDNVTIADKTLDGVWCSREPIDDAVGEFVESCAYDYLQEPVYLSVDSAFQRATDWMLDGLEAERLDAPGLDQFVRQALA